MSNVKTLESQVCSRKLSLALTKLGIKIDSSLYYGRVDTKVVILYGKTVSNLSPAFTAQELLRLMPYEIIEKDGYTRWLNIDCLLDGKKMLEYTDGVRKSCYRSESKKMADAVAKCLIMVLKKWPLLVA